MCFASRLVALPPSTDRAARLNLAHARQQISKDLDLSALSESLAASSVMIVKLDGAEASFVSETTRLLSSTSIREERIRRPLAR